MEWSNPHYLRSNSTGGSASAALRIQRRGSGIQGRIYKEEEVVTVVVVVVVGGGGEYC